MSNAVVPSSGGFSQQGQADWVALSSSIVSFSVGAMARHSRAGVDPYALQIGKVMCANFELVPAVQQLMNREISKLKKRGACENLLWFGFGIKDIIVDLAESEEGLSLVALCSSLLTAYDEPYSAEVLRELCRQANVPRQFTPALSQWRPLLSLCSGVLSASHYDLVQRGFRRVMNSTDQVASARGSDPQSVARALVELAKVQHGATAFLTISGHADSSWLATFAEQILNLNIALIDGDSSILHRSQKRRGAVPQVTFTTPHGEGNLPYKIEKTELIKQPTNLIRLDSCRGTASNINTSSTWSSILHDAFGSHTSLWLSGKYRKLLPAMLTCSVTVTVRGYRHFLHLQAHSMPSRRVTESLPYHDRLASNTNIMTFVRQILPDTASCNDGDRITLDQLIQLYPATLEPFFLENHEAKSGVTGRYDCGSTNCPLRIVACIRLYLQVNYITDIDNDVSRSALGLSNLFDLEPCSPRDRDMMTGSSFPFLRLIYNVFSGTRVHPTSYSSAEDIVAFAGRGICVFVAGIDNPTGPCRALSRYRVVRGHITYDDKLHVKVKDLESHDDALWHFQTAELRQAPSN